MYIFIMNSNTMYNYHSYITILFISVTKYNSYNITHRVRLSIQCHACMHLPV